MYSMVSQESTKRFRSIEFFLLALVRKCGLDSLYLLREGAGLQPGAIGPVMRQLEALNLIERSEPGARMRRGILLTDEGSAFLESSWTLCQRDYPEMESVLRASLVALVMAGPSEAAEYLRTAAQIRERKAEEARSKAAYLGPRSLELLEEYAWMRLEAEADRRDSEVQTLAKIRDRILARSKQGKNLRRRARNPDTTQTGEML